mmetsp:Transcript_26811/g.77503  ORF Transcript_26811/g.77503 Transcript_26811/m.77503 type:complete len:328 (+) Transcript_26811:144-1127(+)|eukprot:CAMPEP_0170259672 /NCGR_PEP_ID=MMETSP0116_2-20130129/29708_1 /TAXON_ID=400756 /ORGANISM="Durinskia baltica, Strain CSIRO CS-38" /LENGTH=327 /DNA_ID=CAMNT_0010510719 /DNA_START=54 /DNA_END=1037 /DNA_ORIENTATION=+
MSSVAAISAAAAAVAAGEPPFFSSHLTQSLRPDVGSRPGLRVGSGLAPLGGSSRSTAAAPWASKGDPSRPATCASSVARSVIAPATPRRTGADGGLSGGRSISTPRTSAASILDSSSERLRTARYVPVFIGTPQQPTYIEGLVEDAPISPPPPLKTERWREAGLMRWPLPLSGGKGTFRGEAVDAEPFRRTTGYEQGNWRNELWLRSLRKDGLPLHERVFSTTGPADLRRLHQEWSEAPPSSPLRLPFSGATASGRAALPREASPDEWVERPVATGKYALHHMDGQRYQFDLASPRFVEPKPAHEPASPRVAGRDEVAGSRSRRSSA